MPGRPTRAPPCRPTNAEPLRRELDDHRAVQLAGGLHHGIHRVRADAVGRRDGELLGLGEGEQLGNGVAGEDAGREVISEVGHTAKCRSSVGRGPSAQRSRELVAHAGVQQVHENDEDRYGSGMGQIVTTEVVDGIATITLDSQHEPQRVVAPAARPSCTKAIDIAEAAGRPSDRADAIDGPAFCAGADLKERSDAPADSRPFVHALERLMDTDRPTIAAVNGAVRAGGIGLMAACDLVVVDDVDDVRPHRSAHRRGGRDHLGADPATGPGGQDRRGDAHRANRSTPPKPDRSGSSPM